MTNQSERPRLGHLPALDGTRGIAVLLVMGYHAGLPGFHGGNAGVDVFFVLSGFLITALLIEERHGNDRIALGAFYMRRVLRLYPALVTAVVVALSLAALRIPVFGASTEALRATAEATPFTLLYTINIVRAVGASGGGYLGHTWSLAIEEQFYLVWPLVVVAVVSCSHRWRRAGMIALACALLSATARSGFEIAGANSETLYNATVTHVDGIFAGCALAIWWSVAPRRVAGIVGPATTALATAAIIAVVVAGRGMNVIGFAVVVLATVALTADLISHRDSGRSRFLAHTTLTAIGRRSYGLYLYHWPVFLFVGVDTRPHVLAVAFGGSFAAAWLSYRWIEQPFLRRKRRWSPGAVARD